MPDHAPIFILGVPRSGTTLLRTILDSHPRIAAGPETPWLGGHQPRSIMQLWQALVREEWGYCKSFNMPRDAATRGARAMADSLLTEYARARGKARWAEKTPDNLLYIDFLAELFPDACFVHIVRDGLDVAASTAIVAEHRKGIAPWHEQNLSFGVEGSTRNNPLTAALRWRHWDRLIDRGLVGGRATTIRYEDLVTSPESAVRSLCEFLGESFDPSMLNYAQREHDYPAWEWGSADVKKRAGITPDRVGHGSQALDEHDRSILEPLVHPDPAAKPEPRLALASVHELRSPKFARFMSHLNGLAGPLGLREMVNWSKIWEYPWIYFHGLAASLRPGARLIDLGSELSPMPWLAALAGCRVTLIETDPQFVPVWTRLRDALRVEVEWAIVGNERLPAADAAADIVTSFSVIEHQPDKPAAIAEVARVLKPGGLFALSFDICEPERGMTFPEWNGRALTMAEFEREIWHHPAFAPTPDPTWNTADIDEFKAWHLTSAPYHNYVTAAAILRRA